MAGLFCFLPTRNYKIMAKTLLQILLLTLLCLFSRDLLQALNLWNAFPLFAGFALLHYYNLNKGAYVLGASILLSSIAIVLLQGGELVFAMLQISLIATFMIIPRAKTLSVSFITLIGASLTYYILANTIAWFSMPEYSSTVSGWVQAQTTGIPGYPPSIVFLRNQVFAELITFTVGLCLQFCQYKRPLPASI
jgi:hypothetical protein